MTLAMLIIALLLLMLWRQHRHILTRERRITPRFPVTVPVTIAQRWFRIPALLVDFSRKGAQVEFWSVVPLGGEVRLIVPCGEEDKELPARIVRWRAVSLGVCRYGLAFDGDAYETDRASLEALSCIFAPQARSDEPEPYSI